MFHLIPSTDYYDTPSFSVWQGHFAPRLHDTDGGGSGATTALLAILVIAVIAFGIWYVMRSQAPQSADTKSGLQINVGGSPSGQNPAPGSPQNY